MVICIVRCVLKLGVFIRFVCMFSIWVIWWLVMISMVIWMLISGFVSRLG